MEAPGQLPLRTVVERTHQLFKSGLLTDCEFVVGDSEVKVVSHKLVLAIASPVFNAMFFGELPEKQHPIPIKDVEPSAFTGMLEYIFSDNVSFESCNHAYGVYFAAKKYLLPYLESLCIQYISDHVDASNACQCYEFAQFHGEEMLIHRCLTVFRKQTRDVVQDPGFTDASPGAVIELLDQDVLQDVSELELFDAVLAWSTAECERQEIAPENVHSIVEQPLSKIRFLTMSAEEFTSGPALSNLLSAEEKLAIAMNITQRGIVPLPDNLTGSIDSREEVQDVHPTSNTFVLVRNMTDPIQKFITKWANPNPRKGITTKKDVKLLSVKVPTRSREGSDENYVENMAVIVKRDWSLSFWATISKSLVTYNNELEIRLDKPVLMEAGKKYWIVVQPESNGVYPTGRDINNTYMLRGIEFNLTDDYSMITALTFTDKV